MSDKEDILPDKICSLGLSNLVVAGLITAVETPRSRDTIDELAESIEETATDDTEDISDSQNEIIYKGIFVLATTTQPG